RPQVLIEHVTEVNQVSVRFVHGKTVFELGVSEYEAYAEAASYFNEFLQRIDHPQRIFQFEGWDWSTDNDAAALVCADEKRFPEIAKQLDFPVTLA
ncbi:MAG: hypothetical protein H6R18_1496, partial [Proteobacteria bacterium]|nr:hypothetical protein [Pseudomonadota bacterium]